jgi:glycosyltransferase involved in cell wall biosynthesis
MIWLASFPRSGNTFFRNVMYELYGIESYDYYPVRGVKIRKDYTQFPIVKTHLLPWQVEPADSSVPSIYLVRDGRDALVSMAHQRKDIIAPGSDFRENLRMAIVAENGGYFGGWSENCRQWMKRSQMIIRYEDLISDTREMVERVRKLMNLPPPDYSKIPTFEQLKFGRPQYGNGTEELLGDLRVDDYAQKFYRKGKAGGWKEDMDDELHDLFWSYHGEMMEHLGYRYDGTVSPMHQDVDRMIISKLDLPLHAAPRKTKVLIEASKLLLWYNEGSKRYLMELLKGLLEVVQAPQSNWDVDVYVGGKIYTLSSCADFLNKDTIPDVQLSPNRIRASSGFSLEDIKDVLRDKKPVIQLRAKMKELTRFVKRTTLYNNIYKAIHCIHKYPFRFKINLYWYQGRRKLGLKPPITDLSQYDVIHLPVMQNYKVFDLVNGNYVVTMHDLTHIYFPQFHTADNIRCSSAAMDFIKRKEASVIAISRSTRDDYAKETGIDSQKVHVIYEAADRKKFRPQTNAEKIQSTLDIYNIPHADYILCLSTVEPRKNLVNTIKAFCLFTERHPEADLYLVLAGKNGWNNHELFQLNVRHHPRIIFTGFVADNDLPHFYSGALALSYVSYYEGFGLPPLEAMSCRTPVIYGDNSSMKEVIGTSGYKASPDDIFSILAQMESVYFSRDTREEKAAQSLKRSFEFSWRNTIIDTLKVYAHVHAGKKVTPPMPGEISEITIPSEEKQESVLIR